MPNTGRTFIKRSRRTRRGGTAFRAWAFSVVELLVVIGVISLLLALGLPAFNQMTIQQRMSKTRQLLTSTMTRTAITAVSENTFAAVRLMPAEWHYQEGDAGIDVSAGRQYAATYIWRQTTRPDPDTPELIKFEERFEEMPGGPRQLLPPDTWVAPLEALDITTKIPNLDNTVIGDYVLNGEVGKFELNADDRESRDEEVLDADDFLVVFDKNGLVNSLLRQPWLINGYDPRDGFERKWAGPREYSGLSEGEIEEESKFQRINFTGLIVYQREAFAALDNQFSGDDLIEARRELLERGVKYYVDRNGGGLIEGGGE